MHETGNTDPRIIAEFDQAWTASRDVRADALLARAEGRCALPPTGCGQPLGKPLSVAFRDQASRNEYDITGLCQGCQDEVFKSTPDEIEAMDLDVENYGRCICGEFRAYEFVDVGVGTIRGFDCCDPLPGNPQCQALSEHRTRCLLQADHAHHHDFALPDQPHRGERDERERLREEARRERWRRDSPFGGNQS
jgi:hypothetical protein